jgi:hypothetical protein
MNFKELSKHKKSSSLMHPSNYSPNRNTIIDQKLEHYSKKINIIKSKNFKEINDRRTYNDHHLMGTGKSSMILNRSSVS